MVVNTVLNDLLTSDQVNDLLRSLNAEETIYLIGAGGCGMSGLGHLLLDLGHAVAGSDLTDGEEIRELRRRGARIQIGHEGALFESTRPRLVIYSSAIQRGNVALAAARQANTPVARRATVLAALMHRQRGICVAGMHGKTTTSALLAFALSELKAGSSYAIGGLVPQLSPHAHFAPPAPTANSTAGVMATPPWFVVEADESDGTLREFAPEHSIVLNVDEEHLNHFGDFEGVCREFAQFGRQTKGRLIYCSDDPRLALMFGDRAGAVSCGFSAASRYRIELANCGAGSGNTGLTRFSIWIGDKQLGQFVVRLLGEKNIANAATVIALLHELGFNPADIGEAIRTFRGAARRQQTIYQDERFQIVEDYGHHPTEIRATIAALRKLEPKRLLVVFQPHRFSRTKSLWNEFAASFAGVDRLWLTEIYGANEEPIEGVHGQVLAEAVCAAGQAADFVADPRALTPILIRSIEPGDLVLMLGAGDITKSAQALATAFQEEWSNPKQALHDRLAARLTSSTVLRRDEPLAKRTTLRVGGLADLYVEPASEADLSAALRFCSQYHLPFMILGRGSNLLIRDGGIRGLVISLAQRAFCGIEARDGALYCGAGVRLKTVAVEAKRHGIAGMEFLEGIPGTVGGGLRMNAGAMGGCMFEAVQSVRYMDCAGNIHEAQSEALNAEYRRCVHFKHHIALAAVLKGPLGNPDAIAQRMSVFSQKRWTSQPAAPSAGCIFKNPPTVPAGQLIEELGLKGARVGGAVVSDVHGNFIVNDGNATAQDVLDLIEVIRERARRARGLELETEVEIVGSALEGHSTTPPLAGPSAMGTAGNEMGKTPRSQPEKREAICS